MAVNLPATVDNFSLQPSTEGLLGMLVSQLGLEGRASNCLASENIVTVGQLVALSEEQVLEMRNAGEQTLQEIKEKLAEHGLRLGSTPAAVEA